MLRFFYSPRWIFDLFAGPNNENLENPHLDQEETKSSPLVIKYDSNWIEEQARSAITDEAFVIFVDDLEDSTVLTRARAREICKAFTNYRKSAL